MLTSTGLTAGGNMTNFKAGLIGFATGVTFLSIIIIAALIIMKMNKSSLILYPTFTIKKVININDNVNSKKSSAAIEDGEYSLQRIEEIINKKK